MVLRFDPLYLPDPRLGALLRDLSARGAQMRPLAGAEWYALSAQFHLELSASAGGGGKGPPAFGGFFGKYQDISTVVIPPLADAVQLNVYYGNYDSHDFMVAQGYPNIFINRIDFGGGVPWGYIYRFDMSSPLRLVSFWQLSQYDFGGFWEGVYSWIYDTYDGYPPEIIVGPPPPLPPFQPFRVASMPVKQDCTPIAWTLSVNTPASLTLRLTYADYAAGPSPVLLSTQNAPVLTNRRRSRYSEIPSIAGWQSILRQQGEIEVWVDYVAPTDPLLDSLDVQLVLYCRTVS